MSVDNGGNAASNIIRMKLFIVLSQKQNGRQKIHRPSQPIASGFLFLKKERSSFELFKSVSIKDYKDSHLFSCKIQDKIIK